MTIQKKDQFKATYNDKVYEIAGRWGSSIVLSPIAQTDERCLIYTPGEMDELIEAGKFQREGGLHYESLVWQKNTQPGRTKKFDG